MIKSIIKYSQLEDRFDAEYYSDDQINVEQKLQSSDRLIDVVSNIKHLKEFKRTYSKNGLDFFRISNISNGFLNTENTVNVTVNSEVKNNTALPGEILITRSGTVGQPILVNPDLEKCLISSDFLKLENIIERLDPYYLWTFLRSKYGKTQLKRNIIGAVQKHINIQGLGKIKVFIPNGSAQKEIRDIVESAYSALIKSKQKYLEAQKLLNNYLQIDNNFGPNKTFSIPFSQLESRLDGEFYQPKYNKLFSLLGKIKTKSIKEISSYNFRGLQPEYMEHSNYKVLTSQYILDKDIDYECLPSITERIYNKQTDYHIKFGDIVTYTTGAYVGRTQTWIESEINAVASNHVNILRIKEYNPIYIGFVINSLVGKMQIERLVTGAAQAELYPSDIEKLIIPIVPTEIQEKIAKLYLEHHKLQKESKELLEEAKQKVEDLIDKGE